MTIPHYVNEDKSDIWAIKRDGRPGQTPAGVARPALTGRRARRLARTISSQTTLSMIQFPQRFVCIEDAKTFCRSFFDWYNQDHHHAGIGLMTPDQVHYGQADEVYAARQRVSARTTPSIHRSAQSRRSLAGACEPSDLFDPTLADHREDLIAAYVEPDVF